jgi:hypothetical protein
VERAHRLMANDQLTDGGSPPIPGLADRSAAPPFGEVSGWAFRGLVNTPLV